MTDVLLLVMISWLAGLATGISAARLSSWINHIRQRPTCRGPMSGGNLGAQPLIFNEGRTMRGNGSGGPTTPKPAIIPKPQPAGGRLIREGECHRTDRWPGYGDLIQEPIELPGWCRD